MKFRQAIRNDVAAIVAMIADDKLGKTREDFQIPLPNSYYNSFENIDANTNQELIVVESEKGEIIGTLHLDAVELRGVRDYKNKIIGFIGVADQNLEMLFIHPNYRAKGIGKNLLQYSMSKLNVTKVDVNEQNEQAVGFYHHFGFKTIGRSELDSSGKPYPVLHMELK